MLLEAFTLPFPDNKVNPVSVKLRWSKGFPSAVLAFAFNCKVCGAVGLRALSKINQSCAVFIHFIIKNAGLNPVVTALPVLPEPA